MNKNTIRTTSSNTRVSLLLFVIVFLFSVVSFAQLKVNDNTLFTANVVVSSKEKINEFDSSILGEGELVLSGRNQYLDVADEVSLNTLRIADASELSIVTALTLRKNLVVESGVLLLKKPIYIKGDLLLQDDARIINQHFIFIESDLFKNHDSTSARTVDFSCNSVLVESPYEYNALVDFPSQSNIIISNNDFLKNQFYVIPFIPPPERVV